MIIPDKIKGIMQKLLDNKYEAYIIGGAIRDSLMNIKPHDYDIFTNATGEEILKIFPKGRVIGGEERQATILTVIVDGVEVSQYRSNGDRTKTGKTVEEHQATCDFTINAIASDIYGCLLGGDVDISSQGESDVRDRKLRFVGNPKDRIKEDPLRILRGIRFFLKYNLSIDTETHIELIQRKKVLNLPKERVREELLKIFSLKLKKGFLKSILTFLPEDLVHIKMFEDGGQHHKETPYDHSENSFLEISKITNNSILRLSALLHDVAKGVCKTSGIDDGILKKAPNIKDDGILKKAPNIKDDGILVDVPIHFYEHEKIGSEIVNKWMKEYKFSKDEMKYVTSLIKLHMFGYKEEISDKTYIKFFNKLEEANIPIIDYIMLIYADHQGNMSKKRIKFGDFIKHNYLYNNWLRIRELKTPFTVKDLAISGKDLIERYGMEPGKKIGLILNSVLEKVIDGDLRNERAEIFHLLNETNLDFEVITLEKKEE